MMSLFGLTATVDRQDNKEVFGASAVSLIILCFYENNLTLIIYHKQLLCLIIFNYIIKEKIILNMYIMVLVQEVYILIGQQLYFLLQLFKK